MKTIPRTFVRTLAIAAAALAIMAPFAAASASPAGAATTAMMGGGWCGGGIWSGAGAWGGTGMWGTGANAQWLTDNPVALQAWLQMRTAHQQAMQAWYDVYGADITTPEAQQALHDLWTTNWNDMRSFYEQYAGGAVWTAPANGMWGGWQMGGMMGGGGWDANHMWGTGYGTEWMMSHPAGFGRWLTMRAQQMTAANAWWQQNSSAPGSPAAQAALKTLSSHQRSQVRTFYRHNNLPANGTTMGYGAGGWMGLGGMWGGFGW